MFNDNLRQQIQMNIQTDTSFFNRFNINHITDEWNDLLSRFIKK